MMTDESPLVVDMKFTDVVIWDNGGKVVGGQIDSCVEGDEQGILRAVNRHLGFLENGPLYVTTWPSGQTYKVVVSLEQDDG